MGIFISKFKNQEWSKPTLLPLEIDAYHPVLNFDNSRLYFNSRSDPDTFQKAIPHNIWVMEKQANGWSEPSLVESVNTSLYDSYPSLSQNGNLYFNSNRPGSLGSMDIYMAKFENGKFQTPENLKSLNSTDEENDLVIDPKERFIIFNRYMHKDQSLDLFISYHKDGIWSLPKKIR